MRKTLFAVLATAALAAPATAGADPGGDYPEQAAANGCDAVIANTATAIQKMSAVASARTTALIIDACFEG